MAQTKVIIVTGGNRGLGAETALQLAQQGHHVIITARKQAEGDASAAAIRQKVPAAQIAQIQGASAATVTPVTGLADVMRVLKAVRRNGYTMNSNCRNLRGRKVTQPSPSAPHNAKPCGITSSIRKNITARKRFRTST